MEPGEDDNIMITKWINEPCLFLIKKNVGSWCLWAREEGLFKSGRYELVQLLIGMDTLLKMNNE